MFTLTRRDLVLIALLLAATLAVLVIVSLETVKAEAGDAGDANAAMGQVVAGSVGGSAATGGVVSFLVNRMQAEKAGAAHPCQYHETITQQVQRNRERAEKIDEMCFDIRAIIGYMRQTSPAAERYFNNLGIDPPRAPRGEHT